MQINLVNSAKYKARQLTGTPLELLTLSYHGDINNGIANYNGIVKD